MESAGSSDPVSPTVAPYPPSTDYAFRRPHTRSDAATTGALYSLFVASTAQTIRAVLLASEPVDGEARTNKLPQGQKVVGVELDAQTADLRLTFDGGPRLDVFNNSSGYEGWQASVPANGKELTVIALGGGGLATH